MTISKDELSTYDPAVRDVRVVNGFINLTLEPNTVILTLSANELTRLLNELKE